jgi:hypothetical protein
MKIQKLFVPLIVLGLTLGMMAFDNGGKLIEAADRAKEEIPFYSISYVKQNVIAPGIFETEGYITFVYQTPAGINNLIIIHEQKNGPVDTAIRVMIDKGTQGLKKGDKHRFTIKAEPGKVGPQGNELPFRLLKFTPIE